ncbi:MAG: hypothetical protein KDA36_11335, partial [Planctomycetaceae bacterium]|nr:hypothetical protein [Planctomycetaceae bacterium]
MAPDVEIPDHHLASVDLDARLVEDRIELTAKIAVVVNRGDGWHQIPLRMGQFHIWEREYSGPGEEAPDVSPRSPDDGLFWLIKGMGRHDLTFTGWLPYKRQVSGGQFQLSLPPLTPQFESRLKVTLPQAKIQPRGNKNFTWMETESGVDETTIRASITGSRLDFSWYEQVGGVETVSSAVTRIHLKPLSSRFLLTAEQSIEFQQTGISEVSVRMPEGYRLVRVSSPETQQYRSHEAIADRPGWYRVRFQPLGTGRLSLRWDLEAENSESEEFIRLSGFQVEGAIREDGFLRIDEMADEMWVPVPDESELVQRIGVSQVRQVWVGTPQIAYEFSKQPFQLTLKRQPIEARFSAEPSFDLNIEPDFLELRVEWTLSIDRGTLQSISAYWPQWKSNGWEFIPGAVGGSANRITMEETETQDMLEFRWDLTGSSRTALKTPRLAVLFRRPRTKSDDGSMSLQLPQIQAVHSVRPSLVVRAADEYSVRVL